MNLYVNGEPFIECPTCRQGVTSWSVDAGGFIEVPGVRGPEHVVVTGGAPIPPGVVGKWISEPRLDVYRAFPCGCEVSRDKLDEIIVVAAKAAHEAQVSER